MNYRIPAPSMEPCQRAQDAVTQASEYLSKMLTINHSDDERERADKRLQAALEVSWNWRKRYNREVQEFRKARANERAQGLVQ